MSRLENSSTHLAEGPEAGLMAEPPRRKRQPILDRFLLLRTYGFLGLIEGLSQLIWPVLLLSAEEVRKWFLYRKKS